MASLRNPMGGAWECDQIPTGCCSSPTESHGRGGYRSGLEPVRECDSTPTEPYRRGIRLL
eukprot:8461553-Pyramimonas_sp.AAC.1